MIGKLGDDTLVAKQKAAQNKENLGEESEEEEMSKVVLDDISPGKKDTLQLELMKES